MFDKVGSATWFGFWVQLATPHIAIKQPGYHPPHPYDSYFQTAKVNLAQIWDQQVNVGFLTHF